MTEEYDKLKEEFKKDPSDVKNHLSLLLEVIKEDASENYIDDLKREVLDPLMGRVKAAKNKHEDILVKICIEYMKKKREMFYKEARNIFQGKKMVRWKGHEDAIEQITRILEEPIDWTPTERDKKHPSWSDAGRALEDVMQDMIKACSRDKIIEDVARSFSRLFVSCFKSDSEMNNVVAITIANTGEMTWEGSSDLIASVLEFFDKLLRRDEIDLEENRHHQALARAVSSSDILKNAGKSSVVHLKSIMEYCLDQDLEGDNVALSGHGEIIQRIVYSFILHNAEVVENYEDLMPYVKELLKSDVDELKSAAECVMELVNAHQQIALFAPLQKDEGASNADILHILDVYLDNTSDRKLAGAALMGAIQSNPETLVPHVDRIVEKMTEMGTEDKQLLYSMLTFFRQRNYEVLAPHVDVIMEDVCTPSLAPQAFMILADISIEHAEKFIKHKDKCLEAWEQMPTIHCACKIFGNIGLLNEEEAVKSLKIFFGKLGTVDPLWTNAILAECRRIGNSFKECLTVYRSDIEKLKTSKQMGVPEMVQYLLDFLDGKSIHGLCDEVEGQRQDIDNLDCRVTNTESDVKIIDGIVAQHGDEIQQVKDEIDDQGERLDELKEVVDETVEKVEEIDHKTITNAPKWSRDVSKLLNPEHDHDWRFLAVRLGYSGEDIRNWALSPDPTMAILAEWYTTHKSSDATYAILSSLEDMGRTDAAEIIMQSLEEAELLVPQAHADQSEKPPTVFLSYQWDHQPEVKAIKTHLEMAGFPCWMDIGQMGGGDQLFAKISRGMRSSKVVLCMVTEKYSNSENCNKEVNLANLLNKPIIPILIDQTRWPPEGAMSMLFAQLLYIQFYNRQEYVRGEKFWEDAKFSELLGQISYHANPDDSMVSDEYRNWIPQVDDAPVTRKKISDESTNSNQQHQSQPVESIDPPPVFISYQWDKQPEIKRLYSRLTGLGYHCWLDINQMGGGDPLYSKIDKGIRNAKVVLSCITPKYALSANCRREVSLSDALRKPIIPLLLEEMAWPPEGPMSMTFTQLLYVDFTKESSQAGFNDGKFEELFYKIKEHVKPILQDEQKGTTNPPPPNRDDSFPSTKKSTCLLM